MITMTLNTVLSDRDINAQIEYFPNVLEFEKNGEPGFDFKLRLFINTTEDLATIYLNEGDIQDLLRMFSKILGHKQSEQAIKKANSKT